MNEILESLRVRLLLVVLTKCDNDQTGPTRRLARTYIFILGYFEKVDNGKARNVALGVFEPPFVRMVKVLLYWPF
jgi:hypothetical protein